MNLFKRKPPYSPSEISEYVQSLSRMSMLRDKAADHKEKGRYNIEIQMMQRYLEHMLDANGEGK